jgi:hypothetical protein
MAQSVLVLFAELSHNVATRYSEVPGCGVRIEFLVVPGVRRA